MRFSALFAITGAHMAQAAILPFCLENTACTSDKPDCQDPVTGNNGFCCNLKCIENPPDLATFAPCNTGNQCLGQCVGATYCSTANPALGVTSKCLPERAAGCPCTENKECLGTCNQLTKVCIADPGTVYNTMLCTENSECFSNKCELVPGSTIKKCASLALGDQCQSSVACPLGTVCHKPFGGGNNVCANKCATGTAGCCTSDNKSTECEAGAAAVCSANTGTCNALPAINADCSVTKICNQPNLICAKQCLAAGCLNTDICQTANQLSTGSPCDISDQCLLDAFCALDMANPTRDTCQKFNSIPVGGLCDKNDQCALGSDCVQDAQGDKRCTPIATVNDGAQCAADSDCINQYSTCINNVNGTKVCTNELGMACSDAGYRCRNRLLDCGCDSTCERRPTNPPTPVTQQRACQAEKDAWDAVKPGGFKFPRDMPIVKSQYWGTAARFYCCDKCPSTARDDTWTVDCTAFTISARESYASCGLEQELPLYTRCRTNNGLSGASSVVPSIAYTFACGILLVGTLFA